MGRHGIQWDEHRSRGGGAAQDYDIPGVDLCKPFGIIVEPWGRGYLLESHRAKTNRPGIDPGLSG